MLRINPGRASWSPPGSADEKSLKKVEVVDRQQTSISHLERFWITDVPVQKIFADVDFLVDLPGFTIVCAEGSTNAAWIPMSSRTVSVGAQKTTILQLEKGLLPIYQR